MDDSEETIIAGYPNKAHKEAEKHPLTMVGNAVDLGLSVMWADCNVGTDAEHPAGGLYGWGDATGEKKSTDLYDYYFAETFLNDISGTKYDIATQKWGGSWRMPTKENWEELMKKCQWAVGVQDGMEGYRVWGPNGNKIFLPFTGCRKGTEVTDTEDEGYYWTSELAKNDRTCAYYYYIDYRFHNDTVGSRTALYAGLAIRPVCR